MTLRAFQCFRAGTHTSMSGERLTFTGEDVAQIAASYNRTLRSAPLVLGHPKDDFPAYGEVRGVVAHDDDLFAVADVDESLVDMVRSRSYKNVSASFFRPGQAGNPTEDGYYLKHIGFLGAMAPAVKNMQPIAFAEPQPVYLDFASRRLPGSPSIQGGREALHQAALELCRDYPHLSYIQAACYLEEAGSASFASPHGLGVDRNQLALHRAAKAMCIANPNRAYLEAVQIVQQLSSASFSEAEASPGQALYRASIALQNCIPSLTLIEAAMRVECALGEPGETHV